MTIVADLEIPAAQCTRTGFFCFLWTSLIKSAHSKTQLSAQQALTLRRVIPHRYNMPRLPSSFPLNSSPPYVSPTKSLRPVYLVHCLHRKDCRPDHQCSQHGCMRACTPKLTVSLPKGNLRWKAAIPCMLSAALKPLYLPEPSQPARGLHLL